MTNAGTRAILASGMTSVVLDPPAAGDDSAIVTSARMKEVLAAAGLQDPDDNWWSWMLRGALLTPNAARVQSKPVRVSAARAGGNVR
ncbi:MAG: hypothetical protein HHJ14_02300 [Cellulomonas sp.]|nr:hypothetical protein [Cellulomonas sp.]